jgi:hypothetical protein
MWFWTAGCFAHVLVLMEMDTFDMDAWEASLTCINSMSSWFELLARSNCYGNWTDHVEDVIEAIVTHMKVALSVVHLFIIMRRWRGGAAIVQMASPELGQK